MSTLKTTAIQHLNGSTPAINLDASGNIGIGTSTPLSKIHISAANTGVYPAITLENTIASGLTPGVSINWTQSGTIKSSIESNVYGQDYMAFRVNSNIERMRINGMTCLICCIHHSISGFMICYHGNILGFMSYCISNIYYW